MQLLFRVSKQYIKWAIGKGIKETNVNPFDEIKFADILPLINTTESKEKYLSEEQIWEIAKKIKNPRDIACIIAAFYGIKGDNSSELINLRKRDIDYIDNTIKVNSEILIRTIHLPKEIIEIFKNSSEQNIYKRRGKPGTGGRTTVNLINSEYVIRPTATNGEGFIKAQTIASCCKKSLMDIGYLNISIDDIYKSGKLDLLKHMQQKKGRVDIDDYKNVNKQFGDGFNNYAFLKGLYEATISEKKLNEISKKNFWDEVHVDEFYLMNKDDNFRYESDFSDEDENSMNTSRGDISSEGGKKATYGERYARSKKARDRCIQIYGATCYICKFNFEETYGKFGKGLIHVHHLKQLSKSTGKHIVNAREDLRPVCPNCHFIIHKDKNEACSIVKVKKMIEDNKSMLNKSKLIKAI